MTTGIIKTKGSRLYFADPLGASSSDADGVVILFVACPTAITGLGGPRGQIPSSCLDSNADEFEAGREAPATVNVPFNYIPRSAAHQALKALKASGDKISWMVVFSDAGNAGDYPTTVDSNQRLISAGPTTAEFLGYISDMTFDGQDNDIWRGTLTIQRSGDIVWDEPVADLP